jgi:hypothetical protein
MPVDERQNEAEQLAALADLQRRHTAADKEAERARGAMNEILGRLQKEFGCNSLKAARDKLANINKREAQLFDEFRKAKAKFEAEWDHIKNMKL